MSTDTTPTTDTTRSAAPAVHAPFARSGRTWRQDSIEEGATDWALARFALSERSFASYANDPGAEEARRLADKLTAEEARRIDAFLAAGVQDRSRLDAVGATSELAGEDRTWLLDQLRLAWQRLDSLHDAIDRSGSMMTTTYAASSVDYVRWSRRPEAITGRRPAPQQVGA
ncbi:hypothetical protein [Kitasatospora sp. MBT66]|uniref:hypothetical protein n=1 Tax=Kitasatospora sp. MBT66 TaxID=1444769 RepID=UPI0005BB9C21|nr:hypothetical protein [Kitasatospora sp. MBT66]